MSQVARISDMCSIDCPHGGVGMIVSGSPTTQYNSLPAARFSDSVVCVVCGGSFQIITGSPYEKDDGLDEARVGDTILGTCQFGKKCCNHTATGTIITGSENSDLDDP